MIVTHDQRVPIRHELDVVAARQAGRQMAHTIGFSSVEQTLIATAISEVARNIKQYAQTGEIHLHAVGTPGRRGLQIVATDQGPGIADLDLAMQDGYSTSGSLGLGLPGAKRIMDEFAIRSAAGQGTTVVMTKWLNQNHAG